MIDSMHLADVSPAALWMMMQMTSHAFYISHCIMPNKSKSVLINSNHLILASLQCKPSINCNSQPPKIRSSPFGMPRLQKFGSASWACCLEYFRMPDTR